ncbi:MAG: hypothetical protein NTU47_17730 [Ignavibacteriales bacterium]|nr:hypothetical protein [Ignavibacteriales bacterium]
MRQIAIILFLAFSSSLLSAQTVWFQDDFQRVDLGRQWKAATGDWHTKGNCLQINSRDYDDLLSSSFYAFADQPFSIEATLRGIRAGLYFSLDDRSSKALSHMVRFDEKSFLAGYFNAAGEFTATSTFDSPKIPSDWTTLRIDVDPVHSRYKVFIDGEIVGVDTNLVFVSGYIGLESSDGLSEFKSVRVSASGPPSIVRIPGKRDKVSFAHLAYVRERGSTLEVYHPELKQLLRIDAEGSLLSAEPMKTPPEMPKQIGLDGKTFAILGRRILVSDSSGALVDSISERLVSPTSLASHSGKLFAADPGARVIFVFNSSGHLENTIDAAVIGGFKAPRGIAVFGRNTLVVADYDKLVFLNDDPPAQPSAITDRNLGSCQISWTTNLSGPAWLDVARDGESWRTDAAVNDHNQRSVSLSKLSPLSRYSYRFGPALKTVPGKYSSSKQFRFSTPPADPRMTSLTRLPVMCIVYRTISYRDKYPQIHFPGVPAGRTLDSADMEYLRQATAFNSEFYFRNSGCKVVLDFDMYVVEDTLWLHEVGDTDPYWLSPNERVTHDFEKAARFYGKNPDDYCGLVCPYAWFNYPSRRASALRDSTRKDTVVIRQAVGGGTYGVPAPWKYGKTAGYTSNPFQDRFSRQDWLITHEFHHQIDALMEMSGFPEYYHADQPWKMPGRFGEDFDFNAKIIRNADRTCWLTLKFGKLYATLDADRDGVPDDDRTLPFDEKRLGSDPASSDSDDDGLSDLEEVMMGSSRSSSLTKKDTDSDGILDKVDPEPLYPMNPAIQRIKSVTELESCPFGAIHTSLMDAQFYLAWTDSALYLSALTAQPANLLVQIDANNDGWFHGFDNFQIRVLNNGDSAKVADYYLRDCSDWVNTPKDRRDILRSTGLSVVSVKLDRSGNTIYRNRLTLRIPRNDRYGLQLARGKRLSLRFGVQTQTDLWVWNELFERNYMMQVELH